MKFKKMILVKMVVLRAAKGASVPRREEDQTLSRIRIKTRGSFMGINRLYLLCFVTMYSFFVDFLSINILIVLANMKVELGVYFFSNYLATI